MAFCTNCGRQLDEDAKFCANCGTAVKIEKSEVSGLRKMIYEGELHKCLNCGEIIGSFVSHCPTCGYEVRGQYQQSLLKSLLKKSKRQVVMKCE